ncbi:uncharacterized protein LOC126041943 [Accipiter gentilis]|uniref:uncharacterized protein LOC126041943 n=1 Tax=Astur gentilis TaxID=8957 RepID=UPI0021101DEF|nr:uncharacterized protein LOC126041943 [Accipiter gentilis]
MFLLPSPRQRGVGGQGHAPCLKCIPELPRARVGCFLARYFVHYLTLVFLDRSLPSAETSSRLLAATAQPCSRDLGLGRAPAPVPTAGCSPSRNASESRGIRQRPAASPTPESHDRLRNQQPLDFAGKPHLTEGGTGKCRPAPHTQLRFWGAGERSFPWQEPGLWDQLPAAARRCTRGYVDPRGRCGTSGSLLGRGCWCPSWYVVFPSLPLKPGAPPSSVHCFMALLEIESPGTTALMCISKHHPAGEIPGPQDPYGDPLPCPSP